MSIKHAEKMNEIGCKFGTPFKHSLKYKLSLKPQRIFKCDYLIDDWVCKVCGNVLSMVHGDKDIGNCNKCHVNWLRNKTHDDWLALNELGPYTPNPFKPRSN